MRWDFRICSCSENRWIHLHWFSRIRERWRSLWQRRSPFGYATAWDARDICRHLGSRVIQHVLCSVSARLAARSMSPSPFKPHCCWAGEISCSTRAFAGPRWAPPAWMARLCSHQGLCTCRKWFVGNGCHFSDKREPPVLGTPPNYRKMNKLGRFVEKTFWEKTILRPTHHPLSPVLLCFINPRVRKIRLGLRTQRKKERKPPLYLSQESPSSPATWLTVAIQKCWNLVECFSSNSVCPALPVGQNLTSSFWLHTLSSTLTSHLHPPVVGPGARGGRGARTQANVSTHIRT